MKKLALILLLSFATTVAAQDCYLRPVRDYSGNGGDLGKYHRKVFSQLYKGFGKTYDVRFTALPSFTPEYAFSLEQRRGRYYIISNSLSSNFWYAKMRTFMWTEVDRVEIPQGFYEKICALFTLLTANVCEPAEDQVGMDGTTYYFAVSDADGRVLAGESWLPHGGTPLGEVIYLCNRIHGLVWLRSGEATIESLEKTIDRLIGELRK